MADLLKHVPPHMCYHAEFGRSKGVGINAEESPELGSTETLLSSDGSSGGPQDTLSSLHVLPCTSNLVEVHQRVCA